jgi:hypothetical protein
MGHPLPKKQEPASRSVRTFGGVHSSIYRHETRVFLGAQSSLPNVLRKNATAFGEQQHNAAQLLTF